MVVPEVVTVQVATLLTVSGIAVIHSSLARLGVVTHILKAPWLVMVLA